MTHRFFTADPATYESLRSQVDAAWGYPTALTQTSVPPAASQFQTPEGRCLIALRLDWLSWEPVSSLVPQAISAGLVTEITEQEYWSLREAE
jgi:hypothetical protein